MRPTSTLGSRLTFAGAFSGSSWGPRRRTLFTSQGLQAPGEADCRGGRSRRRRRRRQALRARTSPQSWAACPRRSGQGPRSPACMHTTTPWSLKRSNSLHHQSDQLLDHGLCCHRGVCAASVTGTQARPGGQPTQLQFNADAVLAAWWQQRERGWWAAGGPAATWQTCT